MGNSIRVRFAPSPTGYLHVGGLRTALYNFLLARKNGGTFILRIEDTDRSRFVEGAVENLIKTLRWAGLEYDEGPMKGGEFGPYIQSERLSLYRDHVNLLLKNKKAYRCFCTPERLELMRKDQERKKSPVIKYDRTCLALSPEEIQTRLDRGEPHVVRMLVPDNEIIAFDDIVRDHVEFMSAQLDDQVLLKSDGYPTYHLANVVDDHLMGITHVIRGEEWLSSTPKHVLLYRYFGWEPPVFAHLPLLLNTDKSKLSKRQGDVAVEDYRAKGYLPEALVNFVALLGWSPGDDREVMTLDEMIRDFSLERVGKAGAVFDIEKLNWINQQYIRKIAPEVLVDHVKNILDQNNLDRPADGYLRSVVELMRERVVVLPDFVLSCLYFFSDPQSYDETSRQKNWKPETSAWMRMLADRYEKLSDFTHDGTQGVLRAYAEELGIGAGKLIHPARLALTGLAGGPGLFEIIALLGKDCTARRLRRAADKLQ